jgi:hypothetical protein
VLLLSTALFIGARGWHSETHRTFSLTALSLLGWLVTLFLFKYSRDSIAVLWLGRANFATVVFAALFAYLFVRAIASLEKPRWYVPLVVSAVVLALITVLTPLVDQAELVTDTGSNHVTVYGMLFPLYAVYVVGLLIAAVWLAFTERMKHVRGPVRDQLTLVGAGTLATGIIALVTNVLLPYAFGDFRFTDAGPLSTVLFLAGVAYAVLKHRLFNIRVLVRRTLVYGVLLSASIAAYSALIVLATDWFAGEGRGAVERFAVLLVAFSFDPFRRFLESRVDALLFNPSSNMKR